MISAGEFRNGVTFEQDGQVLQVVEFQHVKPGKGAAFVRTKTKNEMCIRDSCVDALDGAPGVYSARYCGHHGDDEANNDKLLENMKDVPAGQRGAKFVAAVCFILPTGQHLTCPVSYTHLDVYKRQASQTAPLIGEPLAER